MEAITSVSDPVVAAAQLLSEIDSQKEVVAAESLELPSGSLAVLLTAWKEAVDNGLAFSAHSVKPDQPLDFARNRRVRVVMDRDESSVEVTLTHIPTRHPSVRR